MFTDLISNCEKELFSKANNLFSDEGLLLSQLENEPLAMEDDVSFDFMNLPNNLIKHEQENSFDFNKQKQQPVSLENPLPSGYTEKPVQQVNSIPIPQSVQNTHPTLAPSPVINSPVSSPPQIVPKSITIPQNPTRVVLQPSGFVLQPSNGLAFQNIQTTVPINQQPVSVAIDGKSVPLSIQPQQPSVRKKQKTIGIQPAGGNVVTVQSMGQIHVPAEQMKQASCKHLFEIILM